MSRLSEERLAQAALRVRPEEAREALGNVTGASDLLEAKQFAKWTSAPSPPPSDTKPTEET